MLERLLKRPIGEIIENSIVEVIGNIYENSELLESVEE
ncbi:YopX family protein [Streptococcus agalactiae]